MGSLITDVIFNSNIAAAGSNRVVYPAAAGR